MSNAPKRYRVRPSGPLRGSVRVPGDKSIGHRSLIFGALGRGVSRITGLSEGLDNAATRQAFRSMGVAVESTDEVTKIHGVGLHGLRMLNPAVFSRLSLAGAGSTNAAVNSGSLDRFGQYLPATAAQRAAVIADRIEAFNSAPAWAGAPTQEALFA